MSAKTVSYSTLIFVVFLITSYGKCQATEQYHTENKNDKTAQTMRWNFDTEQVGGLPAGVKVFSGNWVIRGELDTLSQPNALCQTGTESFPALSLSDKVFIDVVVSTNFKPISGKTDQAAGIIFRIQDKDNYYILRANALEDNVNIYKYTGGHRRDIKEGSAKVPSGEWQELRAEVKGENIRGFLNGKLVVEAHDSTFKDGKVGVWTKADSVTCFDNIKVTVQ